jgi:hypothetical protein
VLAYQHQGVGEQVQCYRQPPPFGTHHKLLLFQLLAALVINRHVVSIVVAGGLKSWAEAADSTC